MTAHSGTAAESADSNKCICCKRSKTGGSFFEVEIIYSQGYEPRVLEFRYGYWSADIDVFQDASRQGCQRCAVAFDMATTWKENNPRNDWRYITVYGEGSKTMVANVSVRLAAALDVGAEFVALKLLSANRRCFE